MAMDDLTTALLMGGMGGQSGYAGMAADPSLAAIVPKLGLAAAMMQGSMSTAPASPMQALARVAQGFVGGRTMDTAGQQLSQMMQGSAASAAATLPDGDYVKRALTSPNPYLQMQALKSYPMHVLSLGQPEKLGIGEQSMMPGVPNAVASNTNPMSPEGKLAADVVNPALPATAQGPLTSALMKSGMENGMLLSPSGAAQLPGYVGGAAGLAGATRGAQEQASVGPQSAINANRAASEATYRPVEVTQPNAAGVPTQGVTTAGALARALGTAPPMGVPMPTGAPASVAGVPRSAGAPMAAPRAPIAPGVPLPPPAGVPGGPVTGIGAGAPAASPLASALAGPPPAPMAAPSPSPLARAAPAPAPGTIPMIGAKPAMTPEQTQDSEGLGKVSAAITEAAQKAPITMQRLDVLQNAASQFRPGASAEQRLAGARGMTDLLQGIGVEPPAWLTNGAAAGETIGKEGGYLAAEMTRSLGSREAASVFNQIRSIVPNLQLSQGGFSTLVSSLRQGAQRDQDMAGFRDQWLADPANNGSIRGMTDAFEQKFPVEAYASRVVPYPVPKTPDALKPNTIYRGPNGLGLWNGQAFLPVQ